MPKLAFVLLIMMGVFFIPNGYETLGGPIDKLTLKAPPRGTPVTRGDLDQLYFLVSNADKLLQDSVDIVFVMVANKEQRKEIEMREKAVGGIKDPKEKEAARQQIKEDKEAIALRNSDSKEASNKIATLKSEQRQLFLDATYNTLLAGLMDQEAARRAQGLLQAIQSNPTYAVTFANDIDKTKNIIATVPSQAEKTIKLGNNLVKLAKVNKIEPAIPKSFAEKPKTNDNFDDTQTSVQAAKNTQSPGGGSQEVHLEDSKPSQSTTKLLVVRPDFSSAKPKDSGLRDREPSQSSRTAFAAWTFVIIRSGAGNEFAAVTDVKRGDKLLILGEKGEWLNVKIESGKQGWVNRRLVK